MALAIRFQWISVGVCLTDVSTVGRKIGRDIEANRTEAVVVSDREIVGMDRSGQETVPRGRVVPKSTIARSTEH